MASHRASPPGRSRKPVSQSAVRVNRQLQQQFDEALVQYPPDDDPVKVSVWNQRYGHIVETYNLTVDRLKVESEQAAAKAAAAARQKRRQALFRVLQLAAIIVVALLVVGGLAALQAADDRATKQEDIKQSQAQAAIDTCVQSVIRHHGAQLVSHRQETDSLAEGEAGWVDSESVVVNDAMSALMSGHTGSGHVAPGALVATEPEWWSYHSYDYLLLQRQHGRLVLTVLYPADHPAQPPQQPLKNAALLPLEVHAEQVNCKLS